MAPRSVRFGVRSRRLSNVGSGCHCMGDQKFIIVELLRASKGTRLHLQSLAPTNPHWARVVGYGPSFLCVIHKEGLCLSSGGIIRLMMMIIKIYTVWSLRQK
jgi:hypothetical protein